MSKRYPIFSNFPEVIFFKIPIVGTVSIMRRMLSKWWQDLSVSKKLFSVVGIMALLIAMELLTLIFAMNTLSAVRAFVGGEGLWSKAQKTAVYYLQQYVHTHNERQYDLYLEHLKVPMGDHEARLELEKPQMEMKVVVDGFLQGQNHPQDILKMVGLVRRFYDEPHLAKALEKWRQGDDSIFELMALGRKVHFEIRKKNPDKDKIEQLMAKISLIDIELTKIENEFSSTLGEASRWLENVLLVILLIAVALVESTGLYLTYRFGKRLTRVLGDLNRSAILVGQGDYSQKVNVRSEDELGQLGRSLNSMIDNLKKQTDERQNAELASQAKNLFLANMSHEIRTPLTAILGFADILSDPNLSREERERYLSIVKRTGESLKTIVNDILDVAKIEAEKVEISSSEFSLTQMLSDIFVLMDLRCQEKGIELIFEKKSEVSEYIYSDQSRLRQILINLLGNSIKFTERGQVRLVYEVVGNLLVFTIHDSGAGISKTQRMHLFQPFSQGDSSVKKKYGGTGLGLIIAKKLAELLGGDVVLLESAPQKGSTFRAHVSYYPVEKQVNLKTVNEEKSSARPLANKKILVVEDSADNQILTEFYLAKNGASIEFANNGEEALKKAATGTFDLILMDIQMPVMDGFTATEEIRKMGIMTPIIALTGYAMKEDYDRCLKAGCNECLTKPIDKKKLIEAAVKFT